MKPIQRPRAHTTQPRRVVGYARVSQAREEMISPEIQFKSIRQWALENGHQIVAEIVDLNASGRNFDRKIQDAIAMVEAGQATDIVVYKFSRFGRSRPGWQLNLGRLHAKGGDLHSSSEDIDATTAAGKFQRGIFAEVAAFESDRFSEQWIDAQGIRYDMGLPHSGFPRFGYVHHKCGSQPLTATGQPIVHLKDPSCRSEGCREEYRIDPVTGPVLAQMYRMYNSGTALAKVAEWLNLNAVPTRRGKRWRSSGVADILDAGFGAGLLQVGINEYRSMSVRPERDWLPGSQQPVITSAEWEAFLERRTNNRGNAATTRTKWPLSGITRCGLCEGPMTCTTGGPAGKQIKGYILRCVNMQDNNSCPGLWRVTHHVEAAFLTALDELADELAAAGRRAARTVQPVSSDQTILRKRLTSELRVVKQGEARLMDAVIAGTWTSDEVADKRSELREKAADLTARLAAIQAPATVWTPPKVRSLREDWPALPLTTRREMVRTVVETITVLPDKTVEVALVPALRGGS